MPKTRLTSRVPANLSNAKGLAGRGYRPLPGERSMTKAHSAKQYDLLKQHYRQLEKYGQAGYRELQNGRFRYYSKISPANKSGEMAGRRLVREWAPRTGTTRTWHETVDRSGRVRIVRPQGPGNVKIHYQFDNSGNYKGKF